MRKIHQKAIQSFVDLCEEIVTPNLSVRRIDNPDFSSYSKYSGVYILYSYSLPIAIRQPCAYGKCVISVVKYDRKNPAYFEKFDEMTGERIFQKSATTTCHVSNLLTYIRETTTNTLIHVYKPEQFTKILEDVRNGVIF